jgi:hypothetical protein
LLGDCRLRVDLSDGLGKEFGVAADLTINHSGIVAHGKTPWKKSAGKKWTFINV